MAVVDAAPRAGRRDRCAAHGKAYELSLVALRQNPGARIALRVTQTFDGAPRFGRSTARARPVDPTRIGKHETKICAGGGAHVTATRPACGPLSPSYRDAERPRRSLDRLGRRHDRAAARTGAFPARAARRGSAFLMAGVTMVVDAVGAAREAIYAAENHAKRLDDYTRLVDAAAAAVDACIALAKKEGARLIAAQVAKGCGRGVARGATSVMCGVRRERDIAIVSTWSVPPPLATRETGACDVE